MRSLLPPDWRRRVGLGRRPRFTIEGERGSWQVVDWAYGQTFGVDTRTQARDTAAFARAYVKRHGDIDFGAMPYELDEPLAYDDADEVQRRWVEDYPPRW